jgi:hypothetical protein
MSDLNQGMEYCRNRQVSFPRFFVCRQINFKPPDFPDFSQPTGDGNTGLVTHGQALSAGGFDYKKLQCIRSWAPPCQHSMSSVSQAMASLIPEAIEPTSACVFGMAMAEPDGHDSRKNYF